MKKVLYVTGLLLLSIALVGCSSQKKAGSNHKQIESSQNTTEGFNKLMDDYVVKQQSLMMKQAEGESGEFEVVLNHAQDVVASDEYKEWIDVSEKIESYDSQRSINRPSRLIKNETDKLITTFSIH